jgi:hypothetical protein
MPKTSEGFRAERLISGNRSHERTGHLVIRFSACHRHDDLANFGTPKIVSEEIPFYSKKYIFVYNLNGPAPKPRKYVPGKIIVYA